MNAWTPITFFEGENEADLRNQFIELCAKHKNNFGPVEVARHVFKDLKDGDIRALQAAAIWARDIEIQNAILNKINYNEENTDKENLIKIAMSLAVDNTVSAKDRLAALELIAKMRGEIIKPIEKTIINKGDGGIPQIIFKVREPVLEVVENGV